MTSPMTNTGAPPRGLGRSAGAVFLGFITVVVLSLGTDQLLHVLQVLHVWVLGVIGFIVGMAGAIAAMPMHLGPAWYPIAIALTALPCAWLGGVLRIRQTER